MAELVPVKMEDPLSRLPQSTLPASLQASASGKMDDPCSSFSQPQCPAPPQAQTPDSAAPFADLALAPVTSKRLPEHLMHKNRLQEYSQRSGMPLPVYQTINEGLQHVPQFRSTVWVGGASYTSLKTFSHRKEAEQDVAKIALESIYIKIADEGCPLIREDTVFCKSILNEYAVKMNLEKPTYRTIQLEGLLPTFLSSLVFNGVSYTGEAARNKKEAEQLAARAVILSLLGNSSSGTMLSEIINSKRKLWAALHKVKDPSHAYNIAVHPGADTGNSAIAEASSGMDHPSHEFQISNPEPTTEAINLPISFVHPVLEQPLGVGPSSGKRKRKFRKKANKKLHVGAQLQSAVLPTNQVQQLPSCSVAQ